MFLFSFAFAFLFFVYLSEAGYGAVDSSQSDVEAPAYVPSYMKNRYYGTKTKSGYAGTKTGYAGTKTGYAGTKTGYGGTKTGYAGTKTGYTATKTWNSGSGLNYDSFKDNANKPYEPICEPDCLNNGICVDTGICHCAQNFYGHRCQFEKKPCLTFPPLPMNSKRKCSSELCTITCMEGHQFVDGTTVANMRCVEGQWQPSRADLTTIPDCNPTCNPPCLNGGACLSLNMCQCPQDYRGPQCQYAASVCDVRKLGFNGAYNCFGDGEQFRCRLSCPAGAAYSAPPAAHYTCRYDAGVFKPTPIPRCVFNHDTVIITPGSHHTNYNTNHTYYETHYESSHGKEANTNNYGAYGHGAGHGMGHGTSGESTSGQSSWGRPSYGSSSSQSVVIQDLTPKQGSCLTWGGYHYKTFDGKIYSFQSPCQHVLVRDAKDHKFTVAVKQGNCRRQYYCPTELSIYLEDKQYILSVGDDGRVVFRSTKRLLPIPATLPGIRVAMPRDTVLVTLDTLGVDIKWDTNNLIAVEASVLLWNNTEGLCGVLDGSADTDLLAKDGKPTMSKSALASSWQLNKIGDICESNPTETSACKTQAEDVLRRAQMFCVSIFSKEKFRKCSTVMDVSLLLDACQWDYCACTSNASPEDCACNTVAVYAKECFNHGIEEMKMWRDPETCPMKCPDGKIYKACGPDAQPSCAAPLVSSALTNTSCVEGCFCPEGLLLEEGRCVPKVECPCRLRAKSFPPGSVIPKDCNTCTCRAGAWACSRVPCGARCGAVGDPHYVTFDGLRYDFMGHCTYTLLQTPDLNVDVENVACSGAVSEAMNLAPSTSSGKPSCTKSVILKYGDSTINMKQGGFIMINGKEVNALPVNIGEILVRAASSLFIIVQLPNGVDLWWDGNTRVFVDVPPEFHDKTKGLCGTFNLNQKDDFLTPEGDVEQTALAFANKWKTREFCEDVQMIEPEHPCKANVENKEIAEKYCSKLKSKLFESCRWYVDVEPYYEECLYDMCACAATSDVTRCLCPILGDYAMACAKAGVHIQWRYNVKECELSCSGGQEYTVCADSCLRTCADAALGARARCRPSCVEGCACAAGSALGAAGCVPVGLCPCYHKGLEFVAGYKEVRPGRRERELCTCVGARWDCRPATPAEIKQYPPAEDLRLNCSATQHQEFTTCEIAEPLTCKNMHLPPTSTTAECRPGCQCKKGYVLDTSSKNCILPTNCPCHHGGRSYPDGHKMQEECNTCECKRGNWTCTQRKCSGECGAWGDSHFTTFDGKEYDFEGVCTYLMAKGVMETGKDGFVVEIQNVPCGTTGATCSKSVTLKVGNGDNEELVSLTKDAPLPDVSKLKRIKLRLAGAYVFLDVPSLGMGIQWDRATRVYVKVDPMWSSRVKGLCGNYNMDVRDDFQTPSGGGIAESSALIFADSWKLKPTCPKPEDVRRVVSQEHCAARPGRAAWAREVCGAMKRAPFARCHREADAGAHVARCERDACACDAGDDCACACAALAAYAHRCAARGVTFRWRSQDLCPIQCDEECSYYDACVSPCPLETCDNTLDYEGIKRSCEKDSCVEGCKLKNTCPEGSVFTNSSFQECVPRSKCRPTCMTLDDGRVVLEGEVIEEDACHTCRCSQKEKVCTGQPCATEAPVISTMAPMVQVPANEPLKCVTGWTTWLSRNKPENTSSGHSEDVEPLPSPKDLQIGSPMCKEDMMTKIKCRTVDTHETPKETGLDVECSLEKGLICKESNGKQCPDFEIQVYCECEEEPFQCLNSTRPNYPHPTDCHQFYECAPVAPRPPHSPRSAGAVLKTCGPSMMYNPELMVCDWPHSVALVRPECDEKEGRVLQPITETLSRTTLSSTTVKTPTSTSRVCPEGQLYKECAYPCDKLCDHFKKTLIMQGKCINGQKCIKGCVNESVAKIKCDFGGMWRDESTCVPIKDCTCYGIESKMVKPNDVEIEDCVKCQCLDNKMHCDSSECPPSGMFVSPGTPYQPLVATESLVTLTPKPTTEPTTILMMKSTVSPPPECHEDKYINLLWENKRPHTNFTASSINNVLSKPEYAALDGVTLDYSAGNWIPASSDENPYIQVELPAREPIYGVKMQGSPQNDQYVTSYEVMYGDDGSIYDTVDGPDGKPKVFRGPIDHETVAKQMIEPPIEAKFVRIKPLTWHEKPAVRFELIGCQEPLTATTEYSTTTQIPQCTEPIGLENGLPVDNIEVSSKTDDRKYLSLHADRGWKPLYSTPGEWIMWDLTGERNITGMKTRGGPNGWVTGYHVMYSTDLNTFHPVTDADGSRTLFPGNFDKDSVVTNSLHPPVRARYVKLLPMTWHKNIELRAEPTGCFEPYDCVAPLGLEAGLPEQQIEVSSNTDQRRYLSLKADRGWRAQYNAPGEWIMWDLTDERNITGLKIRGGPNGWVTSYSIMYSLDLNTFYPVTEEDGSRKLFTGNNDANSVVTNTLKPTIRARYVKLLPMMWHKNIELRAEPTGCFEPYDCIAPLGLEAGLPEQQIEVSSNTDQRHYLSLKADRGWRAQYNAPGEWIMWDLTDDRNITGMKTRGGPNGWVTSYIVMYSSDLNTFHSVNDEDGSRKVFPGNSNGNYEVTNSFDPTIRARYVKLLPVSWNDNIELRAEPVGCFEPYDCIEPLGLEAGLPEGQIEVSSNTDQRRYLSLKADRGWRSQYNAPGEWIMWDLTDERNITGMKTRGGPNGWVTSYIVMYSSDLNTFHSVNEEDGSRKVFPGNSNGNYEVTNSFEPTIRARYVKLLPVSWNENIELRAEPIGCFEPYDCVEPLGLESGLPEEQIEVSSNTDQIRYLSLKADKAWHSQYNAPGEWIMWDLTGERNVTGVKTRGGPNGWVTAFNIMYSIDLDTFQPVTEADGSHKLFPGNVDADTVVTSLLKPPVRARYFKLLPITWYNNIELRAEPIGCFEPYPTTLATASTLEIMYPTTPTTAAECQLCPNVLLPSSGTCECSGKKYYDGEGCTDRAQCPCIVGFMSYAVGSTFRGSKCDECVCKLGGLTDCKPVKECKCAKDLVPKLSPTCECLCEECPTGTRICPTSQICLDDEKWCDGLQDCPDDERDCTTTISTTFGIKTSVAPTSAALIATTPPPKKECPKVECPPGYTIRYTKTTPPTRYRTSGSDLPPPRPRQSYQRYYKGGATKTGYTKSGYTKTGYTKTGYGSKGGYSSPPNANQAFTLDKPTVQKLSEPIVQECEQFKCIPKLPPLKPGSTAAPVICSAPKCPPHYTLKLDTAKNVKNQCPQYVCVPPPERPVYCNMTGRTFNTFDGTEYKYDICFHILARDNRFDAWTILVRKKCRVDACVNELIVRQDDELILVKPSLMIEYDNYEYTYEQTSMICFQKNSFDISKLGNGLAIKSRRYNFTVFYYTNGDVKIGVYKSLLGSVDGMCGLYDGEPSTDRQLPGGRPAATIDEFGRAWAKPGLSPNACKTKVVEPAKQKRAWELCDVVTKEPLSYCGKALNLDKWRSICLEGICECTELVVNGTKKTEEECRCELLEQFVAECLAADKDVDLSQWRMDINCPADCPPPLVHYDCYRKRCEPTCSAYGSVSKPCPVEDGQCFPGCYCPEGKLRKGEECVAPTECRDCVCNGVGTPAKYVTFERDDLPFGGNCTYLATRDRNETGQHKFQVYATNGPCDHNHKILCTKSVHLLYEKNVLHVRKDNRTKKLTASINGKPVFKYPFKNDWLSMSLPAGQDITILVPDVQLELSVLEAKMEFAARVPSYVYADRTEGLCGVCAGYREALLMRNGSATDDLQLYGKSWQASPAVLEELGVPQQAECGEKRVTCVIPPPDQDICYNIFNKEKFGACHALVDPKAFVESCQHEVCATNRSDLCEVLERYAAECRRVGVCSDWRTRSSCPYSCDGPLVYRPCVDCQLTCDNHEELTKDPKKCDKPAAEGCYCPEGKVRVNNTCIEPTKCFPCDAEGLHYAGDEWQEDACTRCVCARGRGAGAGAARVACTTRACAAPACAADAQLVRSAPAVGECCATYVCVPKSQDNPACDEPKKIDCGYGQVLKQRTTSNGCKEFTCECKPASECEPLPSEDEAPALEPGVERVVDRGGCCPRAALRCRRDACPPRAACAPPRAATTRDVPGRCCPEHACELPKDKCLVTLEWEAAPKGGERLRSEPETVLKDVDAVWLDGPCRTCACAAAEGGAGGAGPAARCTAAACAAVASSAEFVVEPRAEPFACCPRAVAVACRHGDDIYKVGENWTSPYNACETYQCVEIEDGKLDRITTVQTCDTNCQPGWEYAPAPATARACCGRCAAAACAAGGGLRAPGARWRSRDACVHYECARVGDSLQVQSSNVSCPAFDEALREKFVIEEKTIPGSCCKVYEPVACKVNNVTYPEGDTWVSDDPCKNYTCTRDAVGRLTQAESVETCKRDCAVGWAYEHAPGQCCGRCIPVACVVDGEVKQPGTTWYSADNCTSYSCERRAGAVLAAASRAPCPAAPAACADRYSDGCCQRCRDPPQALSTCNPVPLSGNASIGILKIKIGQHGLCVNKEPLKDFKECRGSCKSGTLYNNQTGSHDSVCECCAALRYAPVTARLACADGSARAHRVASPAACACRPCGKQDTKGGYGEEEFPDIDARIRETRNVT